MCAVSCESITVIQHLILKPILTEGSGDYVCFENIVNS